MNFSSLIQCFVRTAFVAVTLSLAALGAAAQAPATPPVPDTLPATATPQALTATAATKGAHADNPYGVRAMWEGSDVVAKTVLALLVIMSVGSWYVIASKLMQQAKIRRQARSSVPSFWSESTIKHGMEKLHLASPFRLVAEAAVEAHSKHSRLTSDVPHYEWVMISIQRAADKVNNRMQDGLAVLATVGSTAPFVGLFGTVWGILNALTAIGVAGQASIDKVAGPVGESLLMTAIGLAVAVPAVLGYNWLSRRNKAVMEDVRDFGGSLHSALLAAPQRTHSVQAAA